MEAKTMPAVSSGFIDAFASDVFRGQLQHEHARAGVLDLVIKVCGILSEFFAE